MFQFGHKTVLTEIFKSGNLVIYFNILERIVFRRDVGVDASETVFWGRIGGILSAILRNVF